MIVTVRDPEVLRSIEPHQVATYLQKHGWREQRQIDDKASIWTWQNEAGEDFEILLPLKQEFLDFPRRMHEVLQTLEVAESRSQLDILSKLITRVRDVEIQGVVTEVEQSAEVNSGNITILGVVVDKLRKIHIPLSETEYSLAVKAYQERLPVVCTGDLIKEGGCFIMKNSRNFVLDEELTD